MRHVSDAIAADLGKMNPKHAGEIRRVANADTNSTTVKGANRPVAAQTMSAKIGSHRNVSIFSADDRRSAPANFRDAGRAQPPRRPRGLHRRHRTALCWPRTAGQS
jgi:hypothetical protein